MDIQSIQPGFKANLGSPGMDEVMQFIRGYQGQPGGPGGMKMPPMQQMPPGITAKDMMLIQMLRQKVQPKMQMPAPNDYQLPMGGSSGGGY